MKRGVYHIALCAVLTAAALVLSLVESVLNVLSLVHCKNGGELLVSEFFADIHAFNLTDKYLCTLGNFNACKSCDRVGFLTDDLCVECAVDDNGLSYLIELFALKEVASSVLEFLLDCFVNVLVYDDRLLGSADHAVIKRLGVDNGVNCEYNVSGIVDDCGGVACADAESGFTA